MSAKPQVLEYCPTAFIYDVYVPAHDAVIYRVRDSANNELLGIGTTEDMAWETALERVYYLARMECAG